MTSVHSMVGSHVYYTMTHVLDEDQLENVRVDISEIGYCTCQPDKNVVQV